jgi:hypothetical protein
MWMSNIEWMTLSKASRVTAGCLGRIASTAETSRDIWAKVAAVASRKSGCCRD